MGEESALMTMESRVNHASSARKRPVKSDKLLLEDYVHFLHSRQSLHLTMTQLNQIIRIHGFRKIHHAPKKVLVDAVDSLELVDLSRSTLSRNVSAFAILTVEDAVADLNELNWQECCVTSLEKLSSSSNNNNHSFLFPASSSDHHSLQLANHSHSQSQTQLAPKRRIDDDETCGGLIPEAFSGSMRASKMVPRRKRSSAHAPPDAAVYAASTTVDSASLASC